MSFSITRSCHLLLFLWFFLAHPALGDKEIFSGYEVLARVARSVRRSSSCAAAVGEQKGGWWPSTARRSDDPAYPHTRTKPGHQHGDDQLAWLTAHNRSALVFDFEYPAIGIGNGLNGFIQAASWAVVGGLPILLLEPSGEATINSLCFVFECGFPTVRRELLFGPRAPFGQQKMVHVFPPTPTTAQFDLLHSRADKLFKVVSFKSNIRLHPCLNEAFYTSSKPCGKQNAKDAGICWQISVIRALLPRLSARAHERLVSLPPSVFHGNFERVLQIAGAERSPSSSPPTPTHLPYFQAIHIRTLLPAIETYRTIQGAKAASLFRSNIEFLANVSDLCTFDDRLLLSQHHSEVQQSTTQTRDVFIASDSLELKQLLSARWEAQSANPWRLHYFVSPGARLRTRRAASVTDAMLLTLVELWLLSRSRPLIAMAFFDIRLGEKSLSEESERSGGKLLFKTVSTFAKGASLLGGLGTATDFSQCATIGSGSRATPISRPINKDCSEECSWI